MIIIPCSWAPKLPRTSRTVGDPTFPFHFLAWTAIFVRITSSTTGVPRMSISLSPMWLVTSTASKPISPKSRPISCSNSSAVRFYTWDNNFFLTSRFCRLIWYANPSPIHFRKPTIPWPYFTNLYFSPRSVKRFISVNTKEYKVASGVFPSVSTRSRSMILSVISR